MATPPGYVEALWVGSHVGELPDKTILFPHETTYLVPEGEALASDNWEPVPTKKKEKGGE